MVNRDGWQNRVKRNSCYQKNFMIMNDVYICMYTYVCVHIYIEFGRLSKSAPSCVTCWVISWTDFWRRRHIYGTMEHFTVHMWASPHPGLWLVADLGIDVLVYKYQFQFSSGSVTVLGYRPILFFSTNWTLVGTPGHVSVTVIILQYICNLCYICICMYTYTYIYMSIY